MSEERVPEAPPAAPPGAPAPAVSRASPGAAAAPAPRGGGQRAPLSWWLALLVVLALLGALAWWLNQRLYDTQRVIAERLQAAQTHAIEARTIASQNVQAARELSAQVAVLQSRVQDLAAQREALQQLVQQLARTRDDAFLGQTAELISLAQQQAELSGSLLPLIDTLRDSLRRLQRAGGARALLVAHAVQADLDRLQTEVVPDVPVAAQRLNQMAAMVDALQPLGSAQPLSGFVAQHPAPPDHPSKGWKAWLAHWSGAAWGQLRGLFTVTRIDDTQALLASPTQQEFLRANLKLRILNARLDLLSRNAVGFEADMREIQQVLRTQFNPGRPQDQMIQALAAQVAQLRLGAQPAAHLQSLQALDSLGLGGD